MDILSRGRVFLIEWLFVIPDKRDIRLSLYQNILTIKLIKWNFIKTGKADVFAFLIATIADSNIRVFNYHMFALLLNSG